MLRMISKLVVLVAIMFIGLFSGVIAGKAAPLSASSSISISPTSAACSQSGGELHFNVTASPGIYDWTFVQYHTILAGGHLSLNPVSSTLVTVPVTFGKTITWTADSGYFWEEASSYTLLIKVILTANNTILDSSTIKLTCSKPSSVILSYSNN